jgi:Leucine-rich repeat (LRR) protein
VRPSSLADNEISSLEGIEGCRALEELSLEANRVSSLVGLGSLTRLRKLQLGQNRCVSRPVLFWG